MLYTFQVSSSYKCYEDDIAPFVEIEINHIEIFDRSRNIVGFSDLLLIINTGRYRDFLTFLEDSKLIFNRGIITNFMLWCNYAYVTAVQFVQDIRLSDLDSHLTDAKKLAEMLNNPEQIKDLESIAFRFKKGGTIAFRNYFTIIDIITALKNDFLKHEGEPAIITSALTVEKLEYAIVNDLYDYLLTLNPNAKSENEILRFIGEFLNNAQIPATSTSDFISVDESNVRKLLRGKHVLKSKKLL